MQRIELRCYGIKLDFECHEYGTRNGHGTITSDLKNECPSTLIRVFSLVDSFNSAMDGIEAMILAHACAGVNVGGPAYTQGIKTAVEAIGNNL